MDELTRGKYFDKKEIMVKSVGLNVIRGFKFTLASLKSGLLLQIDVCSRVFRSNNLLEELTRNRSKDFASSLVGSTIITTYGKRRTYKIEYIDYDMSPSTRFYHDKRAGQISYAEYYEECYGLRTSTMKQPLVLTTIREEKKVHPNGQQEKIEIKGYLIPEFIALTGMSDEQRADYGTMREIAPYTKLKPDERLNQTNKIIDILNQNP